MRSQTFRCIILGHKNISEQDKLVFLYNDELGKIKAVAKGARRINSKFKGHLETLNICNISLYFSPKSTIIQEVQIIENLSRDYKFQKLESLLQIAEITERILFEQQILEGLVNLIEKTLNQIHISKKPSLISISYIIKLLNISGLIPDYRENQLRIPKKYRKFLNFIKSHSLAEIESIALSEEEELYIKSFTRNLIEAETGLPFKSFIS